VQDELVQAEQHLRVIREAVTKSKAIGNFAGISAVYAGVAAIAGAVVQRLWVLPSPGSRHDFAFAVDWLVVVLAAVGFDYWHVLSRAEPERSLAVRLFRHSARAAWPSLLFGITLTIAFLREGRSDLVYPYWMLCYGSAVSAAALGGAKELAWLGRAFLACGAGLLLAQTFGPPQLVRAQLGLAAMIPTFGLLNIGYGILAGRRAGW